MKTLQTFPKLMILFFFMAMASAFTFASSIEGTWAFDVENAPYGYEKGEIIISQEEGMYKAVVAINYGKLKGEKVTVDESQISFNIFVEGVKVEISLDIDGDTMNGKAVSYEGTFKLKGKRK